MDPENVFADRLGAPHQGHAIGRPRGAVRLHFLFQEAHNEKSRNHHGQRRDLPVVRKAADTLRALDIPYEAHVYSAHRTPEEASRFASQARENGFGVLIAAAGMAAHLAGAIAANTTLPVIGIPIRSAQLGGMDALLSTVQMPTGIPVATVAIDGAANAALLAAPDPRRGGRGAGRKARAAAARPTPTRCAPATPPSKRACWRTNKAIHIDTINIKQILYGGFLSWKK